MTIHDILNELNESNSTNHKLSVLKKHECNELLQDILQMTYDKVKYSYGMSLKTLENFESEFLPLDFECETLEMALDVLRVDISSRKFTGHEALQIVNNVLKKLNFNDAELVKKLINRDLRINVGRTQINKVWKGLITKPVYMRCGALNEKTMKKVKKWTSPYILQLKADGTYREARVENSLVEFKSRSGEEYSYPGLEKSMESFPDGYMMGELTVRASTENIKQVIEKRNNLERRKEDVSKLNGIICDANLAIENDEEFIYPREIGNGMLKSDDVPHDDIIFDVWDFVTLEEYSSAGLRIKNVTQYSTRFSTLIETVQIYQVTDNIRVIESVIVRDVQEALSQVGKWMRMGLEGGVLKNPEGVFRDGTSLDQLKAKLVIDLEMRVSGFNDGRRGTSREGKVGSLQFQNDEGTIKGSCSGFSDVELDEMTEHPEIYLNQIIEVQCNDISQKAGSETWALSHPRFICLRDDRDSTNTLTESFDVRDMAMML